MITEPIMLDKTGKAIVDAILATGTQAGEVKELKEKTQDLQNQIDSLPEGASFDEVVNSRNSISGETYPNLKRRLDNEYYSTKKNVENNESDLNEIANLNYRTAISFEQGILLKSDGHEVASDKACRSSWIYVKAGYTLRIRANGNSYYIVRYGTNKSFISAGETISEDFEFKYADADRYIRVVAYDTNGIVPESVSISISLEYPLKSKIDQLYSKKDQIDKIGTLEKSINESIKNVANIESDLNEIANLNNRTAISFEQGTLLKSDGHEVASNTACRSSWIYVKAGLKLTITPNGDSFYFVRYDANKSFISGSDTMTSEYEFKYADADRYIRIVSTNPDGITPNEVGVTVSLEYALKSKVDELYSKNSKIDKVDTLETGISDLNNKLIVGAANSVLWEFGGIDVNNGRDNPVSYDRLRSSFIPTEIFYSEFKSKIAACQFILYEYYDNKTTAFLKSSYSASGWSASTKRPTSTSCRYVRLSLKHQNNTSFSDTTFAENIEFTNIEPRTKKSRAVPVLNQFEPYWYSGELIEYSTTSKLTTLYALWDELMSNYPDDITKEVLGTISDGENNYEIRCYTINPKCNTLDDALIVRRLNKLKLLYVSSLHGDEDTISLDAFAFFKDLCENHQTNQSLKAIWDNCIIKVIPTMNPSGYSVSTRWNWNRVNLNRNFSEGWTYVDADSDIWNSSGTEPFSEEETKIFRKFCFDNNDAFMAINHHNTTPWNTGNWYGYVASDFVTDLNLAYSYERVIDRLVRSHYPIVDTVKKNNIFGMRNSIDINGAMDRWYNKIGIHGYLFEFSTSTQLTGLTSSDMRKIEISSIGNILAGCVCKNEYILSDDTRSGVTN